MAPEDASKAKKTSAYFSFCKQHREQVKSRLKEARQPVSAPALTKALSELWRSLSDLDKQKYKDPSFSSADLSLEQPLPRPSDQCTLEDGNTDQACKKSLIQRIVVESGVKCCELESISKNDGPTDVGKTCAKKERKETDADFCNETRRVSEEEACTEEVCLKAQDDGLTENAGLAFPIARVKRIIKLDKEVRVVAADASYLIANASQLFLEGLAIAAHSCAIKKKHKTVRKEDVKAAIKSEPRIEDFLAEALKDMLHQDDGDGSGSGDDADDGADAVQHDKDNANKRFKSMKKPVLEPPAGTRRIAEFFANTNHLKVSNVTDA